MELPQRGSWPATWHIFDEADGSADALLMAWAAERPLLVRGEPGTGKSQLARAAAEVLGRLFVAEVVDARSEPQDLKWRFDAIGRLGEAQALGMQAHAAGTADDPLDPRRFINPGVLWWVFDWTSAAEQHDRHSRHKLYRPQPPEGWRAEQGCVLLIAELAGAGFEAADEPAPLTAWARLWPFLRRAGSAPCAGALDVARLVEELAAGRLLPRLPRQKRAGWSAQWIVLADFNPRTLPFWGDFHGLCRRLQALRGRAGLNIRQAGRLPGGPYTPWQQPDAAPQAWQMPPPGTPLLILSDLGLLEAEDSPLRAHWLRFGHRLAAAGLAPLVLAPLSPGQIDRELVAVFAIVPWNRAGRLARRRPGGAAPTAAVRRLLGLLSPAVRIEPELLRALRHQLPAAEYDSGCEAAFWRHPDVQVSPLACAIRPEALQSHRAAFRRESPALQQRLLELLLARHAECFPAVAHEETLIWASLAAPEAQAACQAAIDQAQAFMAKLARMYYREQGQLEAAKQAYGLRHLQRTGLAQWRPAAYLNVVYGAVHRAALQRGEIAALPPGIDPDELARTLAGGVSPRRGAVLWQRGEKLLLLADGTSASQPLASLSPGSPYAQGLTVGDWLFLREERRGAAAPSGWRPLAVDGLPLCLAELDESITRLQIRTDTEILAIDSLAKPSWAVAMGRDAKGLYAEVLWLGQRQRLDWRVPESGENGKGGWIGAGPLGWDAYGLYADLTIKNATQRFRWIAPGDFLMGSPENEPERRSDETQHPVTLTQGYWLADTACTQALWRAVMGDNPSRFQDDPDHPVENVSWDMVQDFTARLNAAVPGLNAGLPTEAQWEYACRAGTATPFSFGANISPEQVNYHGNYPYAGGEKGLYRERTVPVRALPCNGWGLYQMHGNVWEWCRDWYGDYPSGEAVDPAGPEQGEYRVLRGGSWFDIGRSVRSAYRGRDVPVRRNAIIGFRLALGPQAGG